MHKSGFQKNPRRKKQFYTATFRKTYSSTHILQSKKLEQQFTPNENFSEATLYKLYKTSKKHRI